MAETVTMLEQQYYVQEQYELYNKEQLGGLIHEFFRFTAPAATTCVIALDHITRAIHVNICFWSAQDNDLMATCPVHCSQAYDATTGKVQLTITSSANFAAETMSVEVIGYA